MKILHLCLSSPYNDGWGYQENILTKYHAKLGNEVVLVATTLRNRTDGDGYEELDPREYYSDSVKIIRLPFRFQLIRKVMDRKASLLRTYKGLYSVLEREKPDLIFVHGFQFLDLVKVVKYAKKSGVLVVADTHASFYNSGTNLFSKYFLHKLIWRFIVRKCLPHIKRIFAVDLGCKLFAMQMYGIPEEKIDILPLGFDPDYVDIANQAQISKRVRSRLGFRESDFVLITGGKMNREKNVHVLIRAFRSVESSDLRLIIFGDMVEDVKRAVCKHIDEDERIKYIGWIDSKEIYEYFLASDVAVFPGSVSVLWPQAVGCGLPLVCKYWPGLVEHLDLGGNVVFLKGSTDEELEKELTEVIQSLLSRSDMYAQMRNISSVLGPKVFSYEDIAKRSILLVVLNGNSLGSETSSRTNYTG